MPPPPSKLINICKFVREAAKKVIFLMAVPLSGGGGGKGPAIKEKKFKKKNVV